MSLPENSGYFADNLLELPSVAESGADLQSPGLKWYGTDLFHEGEINQNRALVREEEWSHRKGKGGDYGVSWSSIDQTDYNKENWSELRSQIQQGLLKYRSTEGLTDQYGKRFEVQIIIKGPTGRYAKVKTGWIVNSGGNCPRIISAYIYK